MYTSISWYFRETIEDTAAFVCSSSWVHVNCCFSSNLSTILLVACCCFCVFSMFVKIICFPVRVDLNLVLVCEHGSDRIFNYVPTLIFICYFSKLICLLKIYPRLWYGHNLHFFHDVWLRLEITSMCYFLSLLRCLVKCWYSWKYANRQRFVLHHSFGMDDWKHISRLV